MRIFRHSHLAPGDGRGAVLALGNFDGVHRGHAEVIRTAATVARSLGAPHGVATFDPHPREYFRPDLPPFRLTPFRAKMHALAGLGCDLAVSLHFDAALAAMSAEDFVDTVLVREMGVGHAVVGYDFVFGHDRGGNADLLVRLGAASDFGVTVVPPARAEGVVVSSTEIRKLLVAGDPAGAARLLGRFWEIEGRVERGDQRGRTIGFPTANLSLGSYLRPATGVYAARSGLTAADGSVTWFDGVANLGVRPTVEGTDLRFESHLFDFDADIYGRELRVQLIGRLRDERRFSGLDALKAQIALDADEARALLSQVR